MESERELYNQIEHKLLNIENQSRIISTELQRLALHILFRIKNIK